MDFYLPPHRVTQAIGLVGSLWLSGNIASLSLVTTPALLETQERDAVLPGALCKQWKYIYNYGHDQNIPLICAASACLAYTTWIAARGVAVGAIREGSSRLWAASTVSTLSIIPFTIIFMMPANNRLHELADEAIRTKDDTAASAEEVGPLIKKWTRLNGIRSLLPLVGGIVAFVASVV